MNRIRGLICASSFLVAATLTHAGPAFGTGAPKAGAKCDGSPFVLGTSNVPNNTSGPATTITNISGVNTASSILGWLYFTPANGGTTFFQRNPADSSDAISSLTSFFDATADLAGISQALVDATALPYRLTPTQERHIVDAWNKLDGHGIHRCFTTALRT
jgi:hypothetical protein